MAVELKSGASSDLGTIDPVSKALRVTQYNTDGSVLDTKVPVALTITPVTVVNNDIFASTDVSAYKYVSLQLTGTWAGTVKFQGSNNNGTFEDIVVQNTGVVLEPYVTSLTANAGVKIPILFKFLRIRVTAYTSGSVTGTAFGYKEDANTGQISTVGTVIIGSGSTLLSKIVVGAAGAIDVNSGSVKASSGTLRSIAFSNYTAGGRHFKLYNTASTPSAGVGTPVMVCSLPAGGTMSFPLPVEGLLFSNGIGYTMTCGVANSDVTTTATAPDFSVSLIYS
jgi:hypothetical protein